MKWVIAAVIVGLWAGYTAQKDRKPVPRWYHPAIHTLFLALLVAVVMWL